MIHKAPRRRQRRFRGTRCETRYRNISEIKVVLVWFDNFLLLGWALYSAVLKILDYDFISSKFNFLDMTASLQLLILVFASLFMSLSSSGRILFRFPSTLRDWKQLSGWSTNMKVHGRDIKDRIVTSETSSRDRSISNPQFGTVVVPNFMANSRPSRQQRGPVRLWFGGHGRDHGGLHVLDFILLTDTNIYGYYWEGLLCHRRRKQ